ncbi:uncharacterized protein LOC132164953 [Corylus avellana]|uniref:uncharacterized protein LOC132164953 n=1 Tax=Corylus avellana TaxID=13451 RepID=UPI00286AA7FB|nr:uncharacterized protein LOC132164953 [Corylus avellana]
MKLLAWNCRGLARNPTIRVLRALIRQHRLDLIFLSERMVPSSRFQASLFGLGFSSWLEVPRVGSQGGIFLTWKFGVDVELVRLDKRCISCLVYLILQFALGLFLAFMHQLLLQVVMFNALVDLGFVGNKFTWSNHRPDHCPILLSTEGSYQNIPKPFRFEAFWTRKGPVLVAEAWLAEVEGSPAFSLSRKWKNTKIALKSWNHQHFGNIQAKIKSLMAEISIIHSCPHSSTNSDREAVLQKNLQEHFLREEVLWKQKSKELWLTYTELNTKYFHAFTVCRCRYNSISSLKYSEGSPICGRDNIGAYLVYHFGNIFSTFHPHLIDNLPKLVNEVISAEENARICSIPDEHEIFVAIKELGLNKALGPDGMTDDVMIFSRANVSEARNILNCLSTYSTWSGQCINVSKSAMFFIRNCQPAKKNSIEGILSLNSIPARAKYLGIPLFMHKRKAASFIELKDRTFSKITGWKAR